MDRSEAPEQHRILAYASRWSVAPGETVQFMVSSIDEASYDLQLFRLLRPDAGPDGRPFAPDAVEAACNGRYEGRRQPLACGSLAVVPFAHDIAEGRGLTLAAYLSPFTPDRGRQAIFGTWSEATQTGWGLEIGAGGALCLRIGAGPDQQASLTTGTPMRARRTYLVAASIANGRAQLWQIPLPDRALEFEAPATAQGAVPRQPWPHPPQLTFAAWAGTNAGKGPAFHCHFNGKLESPLLLRRPADLAAIREVLADPARGGDDLVGAWDFARDFDCDHIHDVSRNGLHGLLVNQPTRGVRGHNWHENIQSFAEHPRAYGAIHFHEDDLGDAGWTPDASFRVPDGFRSGVYAARISTADSEYWLPFFVRPGLTCDRAPVVFLAPTATYMAYLNHRGRLGSLASERVYGRLNVIDQLELLGFEFPEIGLSTYDRHVDGSGVCHSGRKRPAVNFQPRGRLWNFPADLLIIEWLERCSGGYDVITDEDLHAEGIDALRPYRVVVTGSHPEYASLPMLDALEGHLREGGRLMYLGGNGFYWRTSFHPAGRGIVEVRRSEGVRSWEAEPGERMMAFSSEPGGLWRASGRPPQAIAGVGFVAQGFDCSSPYALTPAAADPRVAWAFEGVTGDRLGDHGLMGGGAAGLEIDAVDQELGTPSHALVIARSFGHSNAFELAVEELQVPHGATSAPFNSRVRAEIVFFETPGGGAVFSVGSIAYAGSLGSRDFDNDLCRLTTNVLVRFTDPTPFAHPPA